MLNDKESIRQLEADLAKSEAALAKARETIAAIPAIVGTAETRVREQYESRLAAMEGVVEAAKTHEHWVAYGEDDMPRPVPSCDLCTALASLPAPEEKKDA